MNLDSCSKLWSSISRNIFSQKLPRLRPSVNKQSIW